MITSRCGQWLAALALAVLSPGLAAQSVLTLSAEGWNGIWTQRGSTVIWDGVWTKGSEQVVTVMQGRIRGRDIEMRRIDSSDGVLCEYRGSFTIDRRSASGTQSCPGRRNVAWQAQLDGTPMGSIGPIGPIGAGQALDVSIDGWFSRWQQRGITPLWDAVWSNGGQQVVTVMQGSVQGGQVLMRRISSSDGVLCDYRGQLQPDGRSVFGTQSCPGRDDAPWRGQIVSLAGGGGGVIAPPMAVPGMVLRVENLSFGQPDRAGDRGNDREFVIDFAGCTVRELSREAERGRQETRVSVCEPERRLAFATIVNGRVTAEYDWSFRDGGRTVAGAWRSGTGGGLSIGREVPGKRPGSLR